MKQQNKQLRTPIADPCGKEHPAERSHIGETTEVILIYACLFSGGILLLFTIYMMGK